LDRLVAVTVRKGQKMRILDVQNEIMRIKKEKDICIVAHVYQAREIIEIADHSGDSFQLSLEAKEAKQKTVVMCGVRFMAETVKLLSPRKTVYLANPDAGCPMADNITIDQVLAAKKQYPEHDVVAYVNKTAELKTICDVCVTSSSGVNIINKMSNDNILFLPDPNLGAYLEKKLPHKNFINLEGGCPIHAAVDASDVKKAKEAYPNALVLIHPECVPEVAEFADYVGSTTGIMDYAINSKEKEFIIGTEVAIVENLQYQCPDKKFYSLSNKFVCPDMKITSLVDVLNCLKGIGGEEIELDEKTMAAARKPIDKMIEHGR
jgi:quinolinate synthase